MPTYEDETYYSVKLARSIKMAGVWLKPTQHHWIQGKQLTLMLSEPANTGAIDVGEAAPEQP